MKKKNRIMGLVFILFFLLTACAVTPRLSTWKAPKSFTQDVVFSAAVQAGIQQGMQMSASDRETGTISFRKSAEGSKVNLGVRVETVGNRVQVRTTADLADDFAIKGTHERVIRSYHDSLINILNIKDLSEREINIEVIK